MSVVCIPVSDIEYPWRRDRPQATAPRELSVTTARSIPWLLRANGSFYMRTYSGLGLSIRANETYRGAGDKPRGALNACDVSHEKLQVRAARLTPLLIFSFSRLRDVTL